MVLDHLDPFMTITEKGWGRWSLSLIFMSWKMFMMKCSISRTKPSTTIPALLIFLQYSHQPHLIRTNWPPNTWPLDWLLWVYPNQIKRNFTTVNNVEKCGEFLTGLFLSNGYGIFLIGLNLSEVHLRHQEWSEPFYKNDHDKYYLCFSTRFTMVKFLLNFEIKIRRFKRLFNYTHEKAHCKYYVCCGFGWGRKPWEFVIFRKYSTTSGLCLCFIRSSFC